MLASNIELVQHILVETSFILQHTNNKSKLAGTRDKLIHDYFGIDYDIVWDIIETKIQDLDYFLRQLV